MDYTNAQTSVLIAQRDELTDMIETSEESIDDPMNLLLHDNRSCIIQELDRRGYVEPIERPIVVADPVIIGGLIEIPRK